MTINLTNEKRVFHGAFFYKVLIYLVYCLFD